jgi:hypothetical protein
VPVASEELPQAKGTRKAPYASAARAAEDLGREGPVASEELPLAEGTRKAPEASAARAAED